MLPSDLTHLTPSQVDDLRRKLAAAGCDPPPGARTVAELSDAFALLRKRHGLPPSDKLDQDLLRALDAGAGHLFGEVLRDELDMLRPDPAEATEARGASLDAALPPDRERLLQRAHGGMLTGVALSGGGVRSATFSLAYLHITHQGDEVLLADMRRLWPGTLVLNRPGRPREQIGADVASGLVELEAYGVMALANPELVERLQRGAPLNEAQRDGFFGGSGRFYTDYPRLADAQAA